MKKVSLFCIILAIAFASCLTFAGCDSTERPAPTTITPNNYADYLAINTYMTDCQVVEKTVDNYNKATYKLLYIVHIETGVKKDCVCGGAEVTLDLYIKRGTGILGTQISLSPVASAVVTLDMDGHSHCTIVMITDSKEVEFPDSESISVKISKIEFAK